MVPPPKKTVHLFCDIAPQMSTYCHTIVKDLYCAANCATPVEMCPPMCYNVLTLRKRIFYEKGEDNRADCARQQKGGDGQLGNEEPLRARKFHSVRHGDDLQARRRSHRARHHALSLRSSRRRPAPCRLNRTTPISRRSCALPLSTTSPSPPTRQRRNSSCAPRCCDRSAGVGGRPCALRVTASFRIDARTANGAGFLLCANFVRERACGYAGDTPSARAVCRARGRATAEQNGAGVFSPFPAFQRGGLSCFRRRAAPLKTVLQCLIQHGCAVFSISVLKKH